jgi:hypothetical protein
MRPSLLARRLLNSLLDGRRWSIALRARHGSDAVGRGFSLASLLAIFSGRGTIMNRIALALTFTALLGAASPAAAATIFLDTTPLQAIGGTWYLDFQLVDGDGVANNTVTVENIDLGGGAHGGGDAFAGGASGAFPDYTLADTALFNGVLAPFTAGTHVQFDMTFTSNFAGGTPDTFTWAVLDSSLDSIVTDPLSLGAGLVLLLDGSPNFVFVAADPQYNGITPKLLNGTQVPEPGAALLLLAGLCAGAVQRWRPRTND